MRFQGSAITNLKAAVESNDEVLAKELLIDEMSNIIEKTPQLMIKTLQLSKVNIKDSASVEEIITTTAYNLYNNPIFQKNLAVTIIKGDDAVPNEYASAEGGGGKGGGSALTAIAAMVGSIANFGSSTQNLKAEESRTKSKMFDKILGGNNKRNWMPIIAVTGVLLIGAIVVWRVTGKK